MLSGKTKFCAFKHRLFKMRRTPLRPLKFRLEIQSSYFEQAFLVEESKSCRGSFCRLERQFSKATMKRRQAVGAVQDSRKFPLHSWVLRPG